MLTYIAKCWRYSRQYRKLYCWARTFVTGTNHGLTGALIALTIKEPLLAVPASYLSHFACDALPHFGMNDEETFNKQFNIILIADFLLAVSLMILFGSIFPTQRIIIWVCMAAAASPDLAWGYYRLYSSHIKHREYKLDPISRFHSFIQWSQTRPGAMVELLWFAVTLSIILTRTRV